MRRRQDKAARARLRYCRRCTYSDCGEDILQLVHECDQTRVVDVDAVTLLALNPRPLPQMPLEHRTYAFGFAAMVGNGSRSFEVRRRYAHERVYVGRGELFARAPMAGVFGILGVECGLA